MAQDETAAAGNDETTRAGDLTVIAIPETQVEAVTEFLAQLQKQEGEVSGHMLNRGMIGGLGGAMAETISTTTACYETITGKHGTDLNCNDTDKDRI